MLSAIGFDGQGSKDIYIFISVNQILLGLSPLLSYSEMVKTDVTTCSRPGQKSGITSPLTCAVDQGLVYCVA